MRVQQWKISGYSIVASRVFAAVCTLTAAILVAAPAAQADIVFDPGADGSQWWFDAGNWSEGEEGPFIAEDTYTRMGLLPPSDWSDIEDTFDEGVLLASPQTTNLKDGTGVGAPWDQGEGVVYDPANDPFFGDADTFPFPSGYGPQTLAKIYLSSATSTSTSADFNQLTIKSGNLKTEGFIVGRSKGVAGEGADGLVVQVGGTVQIPSFNLDLGSINSTTAGYGSGVWDYRGGILEVALANGDGIRLSHGTATLSTDGLATGGEGRFIMHNPSTGGHVRTWDLSVAALGAGGDGDGVERGVGVVEFRYQNGATRPMQIENNLVINNDSEPDDTDSPGLRSARLFLRLDEVPEVNSTGTPNDIGLFDVNFMELGDEGIVAGDGNMGGFFSNIDNTTLFEDGDEVEALYGLTIYKWTIDYFATIEWSDTANSVVSTIEFDDTINGHDVALMGLSSETIGTLYGDYNEDGKVSAADYTVFQDHLGATFAGQGYTLPNEYFTPGVVDDYDRQLWIQQFGFSLGAGSGSGSGLAALAVPEPSSMLLACLAAIGTFATCRRRRRLPQRIVNRARNGPADDRNTG